jgi:hypothetical protein
MLGAHYQREVEKKIACVGLTNSRAHRVLSSRLAIPILAVTERRQMK